MIRRYKTIREQKIEKACDEILNETRSSRKLCVAPRQGKRLGGTSSVCESKMNGLFKAI